MALLRAYLVIAAVIATIDTVNVFTVLGDSARYGTRLATWEPIVWEGTSGLATLMVCGIAFRALRLAMPGRAPWPTVLLVHGGASLLFSVAHVGLMAAARAAIYATIGLRYRMALSDWPYEYRKDLLAYLLLCGIFWIFVRQSACAVAENAPSPPSTFDILDGTSLIRVQVADVAAIRAAGNYVEFVLADGRRPLMRASMREMEARFASDGFLRTHRSWLINGARVRGMTPAGSGDFTVEIDGKTTVPLSRRYPEALRALRRH